MRAGSAPPPELVPDPGASLPPLPLVLEHLAATGGVPRLAGPIDGACGLPDALRLSGHDRLDLGPLPGWPAAWHWRGPSGAAIAVGAADAAAPLHSGGLPAPEWDGHLGEASWQREWEARWELMACPGEDPWTVVNPLPIAVRGVARLMGMAVDPPAGLVDGAGRRSPVQVAADDLLAMVELPPGGTARLAPDAAVPTTATWEISQSVLDNGVLRAELDREGRIRRLAIRGRFVELAGALVEPCHRDGRPLYCDAVRIEVLAAGPLRAALRATRRGHGGTTVIDYLLDAESDRLEVTLHDEDPALTVAAAHHLAPLAAPCRLRYDHGEDLLAQVPDLAAGPVRWHRGWRCLACGADRDQAPLALLALGPAAAQVHDQRVVLAGGRRLHYALTAAAEGGLDDLRRQQATRWKPRSGAARLTLPVLAGAEHLLPLWALPGADGAVRLLLTADQCGRGRAWIADGMPGGDPHLQREDDCWRLELPRGSLSWLDWHAGD